MPDPTGYHRRRPPSGQSRARRGDLRRRRLRRLALSGSFLIAASVGSGYMVLFAAGAGEIAPDPPSTPTTPATTATTVAAPDPTPTPPPEPVLFLPGEVPTEGSGELRFASGTSQESGQSGRLVRFRVAVEAALAEDPDAVARFIDETLGDQRGWTADGQIRFQRVPAGESHDFTINLVTSGTAAQMCATVGLDIIGVGLPEGGVSCHYTGQVVLNLSRWRQSVPGFVEAGATLREYRQMLVNHEVGHAVGYGHEPCPGAGQSAPVMQQQSISLDGCLPNPWPRPAGSAG